jgi:hypothetical protein
MATAENFLYATGAVSLLNAGMLLFAEPATFLGVWQSGMRLDGTSLMLLLAC